ncbi:proton channel OtopLc-like [Daphnia pulicaria]|uniref:proton channel OtopLc-like n=1 Tax=Daphnia pulicaria TaxID=35523 RepID=UPI001EEB5175|nr:proton channel OtopLc-like [Daphnia pulicaria]XP_046653592.1 proton channel OtopLc-like [Daphnia pulicaria]
MLARQILHFTSQDPTIQRDCADTTALILYLLLPVYSFYQLFILFKYSNVMINRWNDLARFALMHSMATSLFFWFWSVRNETVDSLHHRRLLKDHQQKPETESDTAITTMSYLMNLTGEEYTNSNSNLMGMLWNGTVLSAMRCAEGSDFSALILSFSPYLYPFSIEYSILVVGIWFIMWQNVGKVDDTYRSGDGSRSTSPSRNNHYDHQLLLRNHLVIHADCSSANRGLFAGLVVMVATAVSIIVFFLAFSNRRYVTTGIWIGLVSESTLLILMICAAGLACRQLAVLDINANPVSQLDDLLLFICIPSFFLYGIFSIVPAMAYSNYMALFVAILQVIQVILQTPTIIDGLRRCSRSVEMQASRPGREVITFLIVCNLSMWFMETLEIKSYETNMDRIHFYGHPLWTLLSHVTLPLTLFYRFHSASCLVDIWKSAYEAPEHDDEAVPQLRPPVYNTHRSPNSIVFFEKKM